MNNLKNKITRITDSLVNTPRIYELLKKLLPTDGKLSLVFEVNNQYHGIEILNNKLSVFPVYCIKKEETIYNSKTEKDAIVIITEFLQPLITDNYYVHFSLNISINIVIDILLEMFNITNIDSIKWIMIKQY